MNTGVQAGDVERLRGIWGAFQRRDWQVARAAMAEGLVARWWTSGERFEGADAFVGVQSAYPEGWTLHALEVVALADGRVLSLVRVDHPPAGVFFCTSIARLRDGLVTEVEEYWGTVEPPQAWRLGRAGHSRFEPTEDPRAAGGQPGAPRP
jgi:hypothetical protein